MSAYDPKRTFEVTAAILLRRSGQLDFVLLFLTICLCVSRQVSSRRAVIPLRVRNI